MVEVDQNLCLEKLDFNGCSNPILIKYAKPYEIEAKIAETEKNATEGKENVLQRFVDEAYRSDILFYPEASINSRNFYGGFRAPDIF
jgi:hypothetical protein